jgi:multiple sugar transport system substrate-binding protein
MKRVLSLIITLTIVFVLAGCATRVSVDDEVDCATSPFHPDCIEEQVDECGEGLVLKNGVCQEDDPDEVDCRLFPTDESCVEELVCEEGFEIINNECVPVCEEGFHLENGTCEADTIVCEEGFREENGECVVIPPVCADDEVLVDGACEYAGPQGPGLVNVLPTLPSGDIDVLFWHVYGQDKEALLMDYIAEFEAMYPNINIEAESQGGYDDLRNKTILAISAGETPTMLVGYPDHVAMYLNGGAVIPLDDFIYDQTWGVDINDFIDSYVAENRQYVGGLMFSLPYSKSTEMMVFNKTKFEAMGQTVPMDRALTWAELDALAAIMVGPGENQCDYLINFDSSANFFINSVRQWDGGYTNTAGDILVDNANTKAMLSYVLERFTSKTFTLPLAWNQQYGSTNFIAQDVCMTVGSTAGISYNIPGNGEFEIGVAPIPQYDLDSKSAVQQGPNVAIMADTTDAERLASWLFIKYITDAEQTAKWSMLTGYLPVRYSAYQSDIYQEFLNDPDPDYKYESMTANAAYLQISYNEFDPAFAGSVTSSNARTEAGSAMESIFVGSATVEQAIDDILTQLGAN